MVNNAICIVAAGNSVVFNVHPAGRKVSMFAVGLINQAIVAAGGPANLVTAVETPTIETANELFNHPGYPPAAGHRRAGRGQGRAGQPQKGHRRRSGQSACGGR